MSLRCDEAGYVVGLDPFHDDGELSQLAYEGAVLDWRPYFGFGFDADGEEMERAQRYRALGLYEDPNGRGWRRRR